MRVGLSLGFIRSSNRQVEKVETGTLKSIRCFWISLKRRVETSMY